MQVAAWFACGQGQPQIWKNPEVNKTGVISGQRTQTLAENKLPETFLLKKSHSEGVIASVKPCVVNHPLFEVWTLFPLM